MCAAPSLIFLWLMVFLRVARIKHGIRRELNARHAERERIARDLHDTLFQGIQAVLLRLQEWESAAEIPEGRRREIAESILVTRASVLDGRERLLTLRHPPTPTTELSELLARAAREECTTMGISVTVGGSPRPLLSEPCRQVVDIAREAIRNACRHAGANIIALDIDYRPRSLRVRITDDGRGIDPEVLEQGERAGHFGLVGMRERAAQLSAAFSVGAAVPTGTCVTVTVPGRVAFADVPRWPWQLPLLARRWLHAFRKSGHDCTRITTCPDGLPLARAKTGDRSSSK
jgi:signal transduction histidine kinase